MRIRTAVAAAAILAAAGAGCTTAPACPATTTTTTDSSAATGYDRAWSDMDYEACSQGPFEGQADWLPAFCRSTFPQFKDMWA